MMRRMLATAAGLLLASLTGCQAGTTRPITYDEFESLEFAFSERCSKPWVDSANLILRNHWSLEGIERIDKDGDRCVAMLLADWYIVTLQPATMDNFSRLEEAATLRCEKIEPFYSAEQEAIKDAQKTAALSDPKIDRVVQALDAFGTARDRCVASVTGFSRQVAP